MRYTSTLLTITIPVYKLHLIINTVSSAHRVNEDHNTIIMPSLAIDTSSHSVWNELILLEVAVEGLVNVSTKYIHL